MSDILRMLYDTEERLKQTETRETPPLYLPWTQRTLNPFPLASSGGLWGDMGLPWSVTILAVYATVFVVTTNDGSNYWTLQYTSSASATGIASVNTSAIAANTPIRLPATVAAQPSSTDSQLFLQVTAFGSPGAIYIFPAVALLRTGN